MPVVRWWVVALAAAGVGCAPTALVRLAPALDPAAEVRSSVFLVGDAGAARPGDRVLAELSRQAKLAPRGSVVVFLGDNGYPRGIPPADDPGYPEARRRLLAQAAVADSSGLRVIFIPGNHDWDRHRETGWAQVEREGLLLRDYAADRRVAVELQPRGGCPGPVVTELSGVRLVAIDTQWWLHPGSRPGRATAAVARSMPEPGTPCAMATEGAVLDSLRVIHRGGSDQITIMVGHHPLESHGEHGGHHPWTQYLFPLVPTPIARWAWLPIGWIYPLGRRLIGHPQDLAGAENRRLRRALEGTFADGSPFIYASGHDHSLEVIRRGPGRYYLVSGSGIEDHQTAVGRGDSTAYASPEPGFMRVDLLGDRRVRLNVTVIDGQTGPRQDFAAWLTSSRD